MSDELTRTEREVERLVLQGYTNEDISVIMCCEYTTVKNLLTSIYRKQEIPGRKGKRLKLIWKIFGEDK